MKPFYLFLILLFSVATLPKISAQNEPVTEAIKDEINNYNIYTDYVKDENGNALQGIKVISSRGEIDYTNSLGKFKIKVRFGDLITISKDGKTINSFTYDGRNADYEIEDLSNKSDLNSNSKSKKIASNKFNIALDSANYFVKKNPTKSFKFIEQALNATTNKKKTARTYEVLGDAFYNLKQYDLAESNYLTAKTVLKKTIPLQLKLAKVYFINNKNNKSEILFLNVLASKKAVPFQQIDAYNGLANIYKTNKKYNKALVQLKKGLQIAKKHQITPKITDLNTQIANVLSLNGNSDKSEIYINNSISSAKKESPKRAIIQQNKAADYYGRNNNISKEIKLRKETLKSLETHKKDKKDKKIVTDDAIITKQKIKYDIGNALEKQANYNEAITYYKASAADAVLENDIETEKEAVQGLSEVYAKIGDDSNALKNYKKYTQLFDIIYQQKEKEIVKAVALGKELAAKQNRIFGLEKERELNDSKLNLFKTEQDLIHVNNRRQQLIIYSLIGGLLLLLLSLFYMYKSNKQRKLANNLLALKSLRSQMNPHFIFNALNSVNSFIASNDERTANRYLTDFSTLMRSVLENSEQDFIPLEKELELLNLYLKLEHSRFEDKFDFEFNVGDNVKINEFLIPPMLLQPYIENAVWHGLRYKKEKGILNINVVQTNSETLKITIADNGIGRKKSKALKSKNQLQQKSKGMQNIKQRVAILNEMYADKVDVTINDLHNDETGTKVVLTLKKD